MATAAGRIVPMERPGGLEQPSARLFLPRGTESPVPGQIRGSSEATGSPAAEYPDRIPRPGDARAGRVPYPGPRSDDHVATKGGPTMARRTRIPRLVGVGILAT